MPFENKGQFNFNARQGYEQIKEYNKMLRDKKVSSEEDAKKIVAPRTAQKQSGFFK